MSERLPATNFSASWARVDETSDPSFYSRLLDATRAQGLEQARREPASVFGPLELRAGLRVLEVGCGTGDYLRIMAPLVAPGPAVGIDLSATLIGCAQQRAAADESSDGGASVSFQVGDAYDLPFPDASFDRVVATQVLLHLAEPWRAVAEMRRVLAPAGLLSIGEWDWDSTCLAVTDRELGRRVGGELARDLDAHLDVHSRGQCEPRGVSAIRRETGKIVLYPWMTSREKMTGMCSRDCRAACCTWLMLATPTRSSTEPT